MDVAVTGSTGLIGTALVARLQADGHRVRRVVRGAPPAGGGAVRWDPSAGTIDAAALEGVDAVVHLAGAPLIGLWTKRFKRRILDSRTSGTGLLARTLAGLERRPSVLVSGSAVGYYGSRGDEVLTETSTKGGGFLSDVVAAWEGAAAPAADAGIRTTLLRTGLVLDPAGGLLRLTLPIFRLGLGGRLGNGRQWMPWIALEDHVGAIVHLLGADLAGPVNVAAPQPVTNAEYTRALGRVLHRPAVVPVPILPLRLAAGADATRDLLTASQRAVPERLAASGFSFAHPDLEGALPAILGHPA